MAPRLVLASQSPRRAELLRLLGLSFETRPSDIDESYLPGEPPLEHAQRLAREKALAAGEPHAVVIGSDTVVLVDDELLGKPLDEADAVRMLMRLQGRRHVVATGIAVAAAGRVHSAVEKVDVWFRAFDEATAAAYAATGEPLDKAGAYGIQGRGSTLVERIDGDYFAVVGLPLCRLVRLLQEAGFDYRFDGLAT